MFLCFLDGTKISSRNYVAFCFSLQHAFKTELISLLYDACTRLVQFRGHLIAIIFISLEKKMVHQLTCVLLQRSLTGIMIWQKRMLETYLPTPSWLMAEEDLITTKHLSLCTKLNLATLICSGLSMWDTITCLR